MVLAIAEEDRQLTAGLVQLSMIQFRKNKRGRYPRFTAGLHMAVPAQSGVAGQSGPDLQWFSLILDQYFMTVT